MHKPPGQEGPAAAGVVFLFYPCTCLKKASQTALFSSCTYSLPFVCPPEGRACLCCFLLKGFPEKKASASGGARSSIPFPPVSSCRPPGSVASVCGRGRIFCCLPCVCDIQSHFLPGGGERDPLSMNPAFLWHMLLLCHRNGLSYVQGRS